MKSTVEAEVYVKNMSASAICPSALPLDLLKLLKKEIKNKRYLGKSVLGTINLVNTKISKNSKVKIFIIRKNDSILINLDGTRQKTNLEQMQCLQFHGVKNFYKSEKIAFISNIFSKK